ncbi:MAG: hypothetical protein KGJ02_05865 [Verrucomicrobiota bacterium]|nr:hypothetical protein [Verrucomicrobiota bacterium]
MESISKLYNQHTGAADWLVAPFRASAENVQWNSRIVRNLNEATGLPAIKKPYSTGERVIAVAKVIFHLVLSIPTSPFMIIGMGFKLLGSCCTKKVTNERLHVQCTLPLMNNAQINNLIVVMNSDLTTGQAKEAGAQIISVHPLTILATIFTNPALSKDMQVIHNNLIYRTVFNGLMSKAMDQQQEPLEKYINSFCIHLNPAMNPEQKKQIESMIRNQAWANLVAYLVRSGR